MANKTFRGIHFPGLGDTYMVPMANVIQEEATDLNQLLTPGRYRYLNNTVNLPGGLIAGFVDVVVQFDGLVWQIFHDSTYTTTAHRIKAGSIWGEIMWDKPPMLTGVEYCTTERCNAKRVYTKLVNFGPLPNATSARVEIPGYLSSYKLVDSTAVIRNSSGHSMVLAYAGDPGYFIEVAASGSVNICISTTGDFSAYNATVTVWYTKD